METLILFEDLLDLPSDMEEEEIESIEIRNLVVVTVSYEVEAALLEDGGFRSGSSEAIQSWIDRANQSENPNVRIYGTFQDYIEAEQPFD